MMLNPDQQRLFDGYLARWRSPLRCLKSMSGGLYRRALHAGYDEEDLEQEGLIAIAEAASSLSYRHGDDAEKFDNWTNCIVRNRIHRLVRRANQKKRTPSGKIIRDHESDIYKYDCIDHRSFRAIDMQEAAEVVGLALASLNERNRLVLCLRHGIGRQAVPLRECGAILGVSTQRAAQIEDQSIELCRMKLSAMEAYPCPA